MILVELNKHEINWIKNEILETLENFYEGDLPEDINVKQDKLINACLERLPGVMSEDWEAMRSLYKKLIQQKGD